MLETNEAHVYLESVPTELSPKSRKTAETDEETHGAPKNSIFSKTEVIPGSRFFFWGGVIFQNGFSPKAVQPEAPGVSKKSKFKDPFGGPRIIW